MKTAVEHSECKCTEMIVMIKILNIHVDITGMYYFIPYPPFMTLLDLFARVLD